MTAVAAANRRAVCGPNEPVAAPPIPAWRRIVAQFRSLLIYLLVATIVLVLGIHSADDAVTTVLLGVSLAVAAIPEGLPALVSSVLALGVHRVAVHHATVKELSAVETLGAASVICAGKTGTLTVGEMMIDRVITPPGEVTVTGAGYRPEGRMRHAGRPLQPGTALWRQTSLVLDAGAAAGNSTTVDEQDGRWIVHGDPTDAAFLVAGRKFHLDHPGAAQRHRIAPGRRRPPRPRAGRAPRRSRPAARPMFPAAGGELPAARCAVAVYALDSDRAARLWRVWLDMITNQADARVSGSVHPAKPSCRPTSMLGRSCMSGCVSRRDDVG